MKTAIEQTFYTRDWWRFWRRLGQNGTGEKGGKTNPNQQTRYQTTNAAFQMLTSVFKSRVDVYNGFVPDGTRPASTPHA
jgi:hypothetical protein